MVYIALDHPAANSQSRVDARKADAFADGHASSVKTAEGLIKVTGKSSLVSVAHVWAASNGSLASFVIALFVLFYALSGDNRFLSAAQAKERVGGSATTGVKLEPAVMQPSADKPDTAVGVKRVLHFPDQSLGALLLGQYFRYSDEQGSRFQVGSAKGTVVVSVPASHYLLFEANRRVFENPAILNKVSPDGIDDLKIGLLSMDDREDAMCNKALSYIQHFSNLTALEVGRSDANDAGLLNIKGLKKLQSLSCFHSEVTGSFFNILEELPEFRSLNCAWCAIGEKNLKCLSRIKKLDSVDVSRTGLSDSGLKELAKCSGLKLLRVAANPKITDDGLKQILSLKKLEVLDVRSTKITMDGLRALKPLHFVRLAVPAQASSRENLAELQRLFPGANIVSGNRGAVSNDVQHTYAPLK